MIYTVKRKIRISKELHSKIEWACTFSNCEPKIKNGNLRMVEKTNLATDFSGITRLGYLRPPERS